MIDDHQRDMIEEVRLPQLRGDANVVVAVARQQLITAHLTQSSVCVTPAVSCALMRSPSGDRHRKSVTNRMRVPSHAKTQGHEPFSRCSATSVSSTDVPNSACGTPFGQTMRTTSMAVRSPRPNVDEARR